MDDHRSDLQPVQHNPVTGKPMTPPGAPTVNSIYWDATTWYQGDDGGQRHVHAA
jgi:hypothetical protein